ncbi:MAG: STAS domain-containing protein [Bacteroidota bacterium]
MKHLSLNSDHYTLSNRDQVQILTVADLLNEFTNQEILAAVEAKIAAGFTNFVIDLKPMAFMNSIGLNFLIAVRARTQESGGDVAVANPSEKIKQLLEVTKLQDVFNIATNVEDAMTYFLGSS